MGKGKSVRNAPASTEVEEEALLCSLTGSSMGCGVDVSRRKRITIVKCASNPVGAYVLVQKY